MGSTVNKQVSYYSTLFICALILLIPALYNGYPIVNPDTATYLASGFKPETPMDRPITYGLLIRLFSINGLTLWGIVFAQGYIVAWLMARILKTFLAKAGNIHTLITVLILSLLSPLSWIVSQIQPDVFTSFTLLSAILLLFNKETKINKGVLYVLFFISCGAHMSHPVLFCAIFALLFAAAPKLLTTTPVRQTRKTLLVLTLLSLVSIMFMGSAMSKSKHVFLTGSLLEKGVLKEYLDDKCGEKHYAICAYKDSLPTSSDKFIWAQNSLLHKLGGWASTKKEFSDIDRDILTSPRYLSLFIRATMSQACDQAITFNIGDGNSTMGKGSNVDDRIAAYIPRERETYRNDRQNTRYLNEDLPIPNVIIIIVVIASLIITAIAQRHMHVVSHELRIFQTITIVSILLNILDCAAFTVLNGRYGCKMIWLIPLCAIILVYYYRDRKLQARTK